MTTGRRVGIWKNVLGNVLVYFSLLAAFGTVMYKHGALEKEVQTLNKEVERLRSSVDECEKGHAGLRNDIKMASIAEKFLRCEASGQTFDLSTYTCGPAPAPKR